MNTVAKVVGFDLSALDKQEQATHKVGVIFDADGEPVSGFVIVGKNSIQYQEVTKKMRANNIQQASKRKQDIDAATEEGAQFILNKVLGNENQIAMAVTVGWFGFTENGQEKPFDEEYVAHIFKKMPQWQARVLEALEKDANFMTV